jgi:hypothetical protein
MTEDARLRALPLAGRLRIAAVDLAVTGAPRALVEALWLAVGKLDASALAHHRQAATTSTSSAKPTRR